jgi:hypothetical protein
MITISESGMTFGPFAETHCYRIEESPLHNSAQPGVKIAEFLLIRNEHTNQPPQVWIVEAKSSSPNPNSPLPETAKNLSDFLGEICDKLLNALTLGVAACIGRHSDAGAVLPAAFTKLELGRTVFRLVLVIKGHKAEWLPPLKDALTKKLHVTSRTWDLGAGSVVVMNDTMARSLELIS